MPKWVYLSPHLDDVAISCGGLVWEQVQAGERVEIWTLCAGDPPAGPLSSFALELHARWQTDREAAALRRLEDQQACQELGAAWFHFPFPDCIYRSDSDGRHLYASQEAIFGEIQPADQALIAIASKAIADGLVAGDLLVCPLAIGNHVDHQATRAAAESTNWPLMYYADYPYTYELPEQIQALRASGWQAQVFPLSAPALQSWARAVAAHRSQISTFWPGDEALVAGLAAYREQMGGGCLWRPPQHASARFS